MTSRSLHRVYHEVAPIRLRAAFRVLSARRCDTGRRCVLVAPGRSAPPPLTAERFDAITRAHAAIDHAAIPRVSARHVLDGIPVLELDCPAIADGIELVQRLSALSVRLPYGAADAFIVAIRQVLEAAHRTGLPGLGEPLCLGRMSGANLLFDADGRFWLVGFGFDFPVLDEAGRPDAEVPFFQPVELVGGGAPSPMGDYVALVLFSRSVLPNVELPDGLARLMRGEIGPADLPLIESLRWVEQRAIGEVPALRASMKEAIEVADRIRAALGVTLDPARFAGFASRALLTEIANVPVVAPDGFTVGPDAAWIDVGSGPQRLGTSMRRILVGMLARHALGSTDPFDTSDLVELGWPGQSLGYEAARNRLYVTINRLRKAGLDPYLERFDDGYRIAPRAVVSRVRS